MSNVHNPDLAWQVNLPDVGQDPVNFVFTTTLPDGEFSFKFMWFDSKWNAWVTLPSGEIRGSGVSPNTLSWTGFYDYYIQFLTTLESITQNDLSKVTMVVYKL